MADQKHNLSVPAGWEGHAVATIGSPGRGPPLPPKRAKTLVSSAPYRAPS